MSATNHSSPSKQHDPSKAACKYITKNKATGIGLTPIDGSGSFATDFSENRIRLIVPLWRGWEASCYLGRKQCIKIHGAKFSLSEMQPELGLHPPSPRLNLVCLISFLVIYLRKSYATISSWCESCHEGSGSGSVLFELDSRRELQSCENTFYFWSVCTLCMQRTWIKLPPAPCW